ncbi:MAG: hypothetical protein HWD61_08760 [Parachlamydiaceae bacterium]|nr:MAG: hypothetical protein HWD61_08760 [Parachlamydiaceae bacterium]
MSFPQLNRCEIGLKPFHSVDQEVEKALCAEPAQSKYIQEEILPESLQKIVQSALHYELNKMVDRHDQNKHYEEIEAILGTIQSPTQFLHDYAAEPYYYIEPLLNLSSKAKEAIYAVVTPIEAAKTALQGIELMGSGAALIVQAAQLQEAKCLLKTKEAQLQNDPLDENLRTSIVQLRSYISSQGNTIKEKVADFATLFCIVGLNTASFILEALKEARPFINYPMGWSFYLLDVLTASISFWRSQKAKSAHEVWMTQIAKNTRTFTQAEKLLKVRQERMIFQKVEKMSFEDLKTRLEITGFNFENKGISSWESFLAKIEEDDVRKEVAAKLLTDQDEKEAAVNVMLRNSFQSLTQAKGENEKIHPCEFSTIDHLFSFVLFICSLCHCARSFGCCRSDSNCCFNDCPAYSGIFLLSWIVWGAGLYFFYRFRPNLFKCF